MGMDTACCTSRTRTSLPRTCAARSIRSKTPLYRHFYTITKPVLPLFRRLLPNQILTTEELGRAMLIALKRGAQKSVLETRDIRALLRSQAP